MTHDEILTKAIEKAVANGYTPTMDDSLTTSELVRLKQVIYNVIWEGKQSSYTYTQDPYSLIFNHDFAKALWPELPRPFREGGKFSYPAWQRHLQAMVISSDPIAYLGANM